MRHFFLTAILLCFFAPIAVASQPASSELQRGEPSWIDPRCPGSGDPPPVNVPADLPKLITVLDRLTDQNGNHFWKTTPEVKADLHRIFDASSKRTKIEQFYQLMYLIQKYLPRESYPLEVGQPRIREALLTARVFKDPTFPNSIKTMRVAYDTYGKKPVFTVFFKGTEIRFPLNEGKGFSMWKNDKCQVAKELVFYDGFSFRLEEKKISGNFLVYGFEKAQLYGDFGTRGLIHLDLGYVDLEKVEFINGTDEGKVTVRVAKREFETNEHSGLFKFVGRLIPNTSRQRIDW